MIKSRINHWSCSKFADWVRGEEKPLAMEWDKWEDWHKDVALKRPLRHFIAEEVLDRIQDVICFPRDLWRTASAYWHNRFVSKMHCLKTDLPPGRFYDLDTRILHGLFNELKEFVEVDLGTYYAAMSEEKFKIHRGRCPEAGLAHLEWAMSLKMDEDYGISKKSKKYGKPTPQAEAAEEIMELYLWWLARDDRLSPAEASGWYKAGQVLDGKVPDDSDKEKLKVLKKMRALEKKYEDEDEEMLHRLISVRSHLWC
jgi:hypothetical protein